jgi:hypothetical protein
MRSTSGGIAWSPVATRYYDGNDFQAGTPTTPANAPDANGCGRIHICSKVARKGLIRQPDESLVVHELVLQCRGHRAL